jgi:hypothetical protein
MPFEQKGQTMTLTTDNPQHPCNTIAILRAQYEALMAAAKWFLKWHQDQVCPCQACKTVAALRAAGIQIGGK